MKRCLRCGKLTPRGSYCPPHQPRSAPHPNRLTGWTWERVRVRIIERDGGLCVLCLRPGREVDHIRELREGGTNAPENLRLLCLACHRAKTRAKSRR